MQNSLTARLACAAAAFCTTLLMLAANAELAQQAERAEADTTAAVTLSTGSAA